MASSASPGDSNLALDAGVRIPLPCPEPVQVGVLVEEVYDPDVRVLLESRQAVSRDSRGKLKHSARSRNQQWLPGRAVPLGEAAL